MPTHPNIYRVFVASPDDVQKERKAVELAIQEVNEIIDPSSSQLRFVGWETDVSPGVGEYTQDVINKDIDDDYDIFVGIMWRRFGTPTKYWRSGTEEEFERAFYRRSTLNENVEIMFYFSNIFPKRDETDSEQFKLVQEFRESLRPGGVLPFSYKNMSEFRKLIKKHLAMKVRKLEKNKKTKRVIPKEKSGTKVQNSTNCELLYEHDEIGNRINGNIERLIEAVTKGCDIRIRVHHPNGTIQVMGAPLLSVENGVVHASDIDQISKTRDESGNYVYQDKSYHYYLIASSNGHFHAKRIFFDGTDRNTTKSKRHIAWIGLVSPKS